MLGEVERAVPWALPPLTLAIHLSVGGCGSWLVTSQLLDVGIRGPLWTRDLHFLANELPLIGLWGLAALVCARLALLHVSRACLSSPALVLGRRGLRVHGLAGARCYPWEDVALCQPSPWRDHCFRAFRVLPERGYDPLWFYVRAARASVVAPRPPGLLGPAPWRPAPALPPSLPQPRRPEGAAGALRSARVGERRGRGAAGLRSRPAGRAGRLCGRDALS